MTSDPKILAAEEKLLQKVAAFRQTKPSGNYREFMLWLVDQGHLETLRLILDTDKVDPQHASFFIALFGAFTQPGWGHVSYLRLLRAAAQAGQLDIVKYFVEEKKISVSQKDIGGRDLMQVAVEAGQLEVVRYLAEGRGAEINNISTIKLAVQNSKTDVAAYLLQQRFPTQNKDVATRLVNLCKDAKEEEDDMLVDCARDGNLEIFHVVDELVSPDVQRDTALMAAAESGHQAVVEYLLTKRANANESKDESKDKEDGHQANAAKLINLCKGKSFRSVMRGSVLRGHIKTIQFLNSLGLQYFLIDVAFETGQLTAVNFALDDKDTIKVENTDIVRWRDMAFKARNVELFAYFLGIKLKKQPKELIALAEKIIFWGEGKPTCREAVQSLLDQGHFKSVDQFFEAGVGFEDIWGLFDIAVQKNRLDVVKYLQGRMGWSSFDAFDEGHRLGLGLTFDEFCRRSELLAQMAADTQRVDILGYLLKAKCRLPGSFALLDYTDKGLKKTVICVCETEEPDILQNEIEEIFQLAKRYGSVNAALFHCATTGDLEGIQLLVKIGAEPRDYRLLEAAAEAGHLPVVQYLMEILVLSIEEFSFSSYQRVRANGHQPVAGYLYGKYQEELVSTMSTIPKHDQAFYAWKEICKFCNPDGQEKKPEDTEEEVHQFNLLKFFRRGNNPDKVKQFERDKWIPLAKILTPLCRSRLLNQAVFERLSECSAEIETIEPFFRFLDSKSALSNFYVLHAMFNAGSNNVFGTLQQFFVMPLSEYAIQLVDVQNFAPHSDTTQLPAALIYLITEYLMTNSNKAFDYAKKNQQPSHSSQSFLGFFNKQKWVQENDTYEAVSDDVDEGLDHEGADLDFQLPRRLVQ